VWISSQRGYCRVGDLRHEGVDVAAGHGRRRLVAEKLTVTDVPVGFLLPAVGGTWSGESG
jgi:hypothetical protein